MLEKLRSLEEKLEMAIVRPYNVSDSLLRETFKNKKTLLWTINPYTAEIRIAQRHDGEKYNLHRIMDPEAEQQDYIGLIMQGGLFTFRDSSLPKEKIKKVILQYLQHT